MADDKPLEGRVIPPGRGVPTSLNAFAAMQEIIGAARECYVVHQEESTKRARIEAYKSTEVAKIKAAESILKNYFAGVFRERRDLYDEMFTRLDQAMSEGKPEIVHSVLRGIVDIAKESPLKDIGDLGQIRAALDDPNQVWEL